MQKKISIIFLALAMICFIPRSHAQRGKSEFAVGYGYFSFYSFVNAGTNHAAYSTSSGSAVFTYRYYISRDVTIGLGVGYENISTWASFTTIAPELTVAYMDTRKSQVRVRLYGSVSWGISLLDDNTIARGEGDESGPKPWAFQATPFGIRIGRQWAAFMEVGLGYKGLFHGGLELRVPKMIRPKVVEPVE